MNAVLPAIVAAITNSSLRIEGTDQADTIRIVQIGNQFSVQNAAGQTIMPAGE